MVRTPLTKKCTGSVLIVRRHFIAVTIIICLLIMIASRYLTAWNSNNWSSVSCSLSRAESDNFFCESNYQWIKRKMIYLFQNKLNMMKFPNNRFFESNFNCYHKMRIGKTDDGGKWVCDPLKLRKKDDCLVYSAGSHGEFSFEIELKKLLPKCTIFTLDKDIFPCPKELCTFHQAFLGNGSSGNSKNWITITQELKHTNRVVDIFKIDIEGSEYEFFTDMFNSNITTKNFPRQILVEVHPATESETHRFFELFRKNHYVIFNKEPNLIPGPGFFEYAFFRLNTDFFRTL